MVLVAKPDLILDNGGDLFARYLAGPYRGLMGGTEETTSGRMRLEPLRGQLRLPILVINDSPIKQFAENEHAVGQSTLEWFLRLTNRVTNGERVTVFGYGACGRGVAASFRGAFARVSVVDTDPVSRLRAHLDGFATPHRDAAIASADLVITVTGARDVLGAADLPLGLGRRPRLQHSQEVDPVPTDVEHAGEAQIGRRRLPLPRVEDAPQVLEAIPLRLEQADLLQRVHLVGEGGHDSEVAVAGAP